MKRPARNILALALTVMYLVITMSPLAPLAMHSKAIAHAVAGECTGDCDTCGCSLERRANHTCCCFMKKQREQQLAREKRSAQVADCCKAKPARKKDTTLTCNCPCGSGKQIAFSGAIKIELLPNNWDVQIRPPQEMSQYSSLVRRLTSRYDVPPDPPPKLFSLA